MWNVGSYFGWSNGFDSSYYNSSTNDVVSHLPSNDTSSKTSDSNCCCSPKDSKSTEKDYGDKLLDFAREFERQVDAFGTPEYINKKKD